MIRHSKQPPLVEDPETIPEEQSLNCVNFSLWARLRAGPRRLAFMSGRLSTRTTCLRIREQKKAKTKCAARRMGARELRAASLVHALSGGMSLFRYTLLRTRSRKKALRPVGCLFSLPYQL